MNSLIFQVTFLTCWYRPVSTIEWIIENTNDDCEYPYFVRECSHVPIHNQSYFCLIFSVEKLKSLRYEGLWWDVVLAQWRQWLCSLVTHYRSLALSCLLNRSPISAPFTRSLSFQYYMHIWIIFLGPGGSDFTITILVWPNWKSILNRCMESWKDVVTGATREVLSCRFTWREPAHTIMTPMYQSQRSTPSPILHHLYPYSTRPSASLVMSTVNPAREGVTNQGLVF